MSSSCGVRASTKQSGRRQQARNKAGEARKHWNTRGLRAHVQEVSKARELLRPLEGSSSPVSSLDPGGSDTEHRLVWSRTRGRKSLGES